MDSLTELFNSMTPEERTRAAARMQRDVMPNSYQGTHISFPDNFNLKPISFNGSILPKKGDDIYIHPGSCVKCDADRRYDFRPIRKWVVTSVDFVFEVPHNDKESFLMDPAYRVQIEVKPVLCTNDHITDFLRFIKYYRIKYAIKDWLRNRKTNPIRNSI